MKSLFEVLSMLNFNLMPTWFHFASQNRTKIHQNVDPKRLPIMHTFSLRFWTPKTSLLGPNLEPSWPSVWFLDGPRGFPDLPKRPPRSNLEPSWLSSLLQDRPRRFQHLSMLLCYVAPLLLFCWRGGGVTASLRCGYHL